mmetsp:Transcript_65768/g.145648  ORF Transcript_65768/g.145648 Transcript_65768/m.145648 type:complete len:255 (+) Transcript_65768:773-1537(+)
MERIDTAGSCLRMTRTIVPIAIAVAVAMVIGPPMAPPVVRSATSRTRLVALHTRVLTSAMATSPLVAPVAGPISVSALAQGAWTILRSSRGGTVPVKVPLLRAGAPAVAHAVAVPMAVVPPAIIAPRLCTRIAICALALADRPSTRGVGAIASGAGPTRRGRRRTTAGILPCQLWPPQLVIAAPGLRTVVFLLGLRVVAPPIHLRRPLPAPTAEPPRVDAPVGFLAPEATGQAPVPTLWQRLRRRCRWLWRWPR